MLPARDLPYLRNNLTQSIGNANQKSLRRADLLNGPTSMLGN